MRALLETALRHCTCLLVAVWSLGYWENIYQTWAPNPSGSTSEMQAQQGWPSLSTRVSLSGLDMNLGILDLANVYKKDCLFKWIQSRRNKVQPRPRHNIYGSSPAHMELTFTGFYKGLEILAYRDLNFLFINRHHGFANLHCGVRQSITVIISRTNKKHARTGRWTGFGSLKRRRSLTGLDNSLTSAGLWG